MDFFKQQGIIFGIDGLGQVLSQILGQITEADQDAEVHDDRKQDCQPVRKTELVFEKCGDRVTDDRQKPGQDDGEQHLLACLKAGRDNDGACQHKQDFQAFFSGFFLRSHQWIGVK